MAAVKICCSIIDLVTIDRLMGSTCQTCYMDGLRKKIDMFVVYK